MENAYNYATVDGTSATMYVHGEIGSDVVGKVFASELTALENSGVTDITVRIMSGGGQVIDGFAIFSAILNSKANVTTVNDGLAASSAGWIFLAGKNAVMADYSLLMLHNPSSPSQDPKTAETLNYMRNSILTIFQKRTGTDLAVLSEMMDRVTWMDADEALAFGFATSIQETALMVELDPNAQTVNEMYAICNSIVPKNDVANMTDETLNPTEETTDVVVTNEANETPETPETPEAEEAKPEEPEAVTEPETTPEVDDEKQALVTANAELTAKLAALETALNSYKEAEAAKAKAEAEIEAKTLIANALAVGKITNDATASWMTLAMNDFSMAKATLDGIQLNRSAVDILNEVKSTTKVVAQNLRDLEKVNPKEAARLYKEDKATYNQLYYNSYGKFPA